MPRHGLRIDGSIVFTPFRHTLRTLDGDDGRFARAAGALGSVVVIAWVAWGTFGEIGRDVQSRSARVEAVGSALPVEVRTAGVVARVDVRAGDRVEAGALLAEVDATELRLQIVEAEARLAFLRVAAEAERDGQDASVRAAAAEVAVAESAASEVTARFAASELRLAQAEREREEVARLVARGAAPASEGVALDDRLAALRAELATITQARSGAGAAARAAALGSVAREGGDRAVAANRAADIAVAEATLATLQARVAACRLVAPTAGVVADQPLLQPGQYAAAGARLLSLVPDGPTHIVAWIEPGGAVGQLAVGQPARVRLDGLPETRLRGLAGVVERVAAEPDGAGLRAEIALTPNGSGAPLPHGMAASVEIEVERVPPLALLWRLVRG